MAQKPTYEELAQRVRDLEGYIAGTNQDRKLPISDKTDVAPDLNKIDTGIDITRIKQIQEQFQQQYKLESMSTLTAGMADDFSHILSIIIGNTELAIDEVPDRNPAHFFLEEIKAAGLRAKEIVRQLLSFSRRTGHHLSPINIVPLVEDTLKLMRANFPATIEIRPQLDHTGGKILADPNQIRQVLINLFSNAAQTMEQTGGTVTISVDQTRLNAADHQFPELDAGNYIRMTVSDSGPGIPPEIIGKIFDPYFTTREVGRGSGIGLAVVQGIVKGHNGSIKVDSRIGKGTTFCILFPEVDANHNR